MFESGVIKMQNEGSNHQNQVYERGETEGRWELGMSYSNPIIRVY